VSSTHLCKDCRQWDYGNQPCVNECGSIAFNLTGLLVSFGVTLSDRISAQALERRGRGASGEELSIFTIFFETPEDLEDTFASGTFAGEVEENDLARAGERSSDEIETFLLAIFLI
jgi:hypothetical protein